MNADAEIKAPEIGKTIFEFQIVQNQHCLLLVCSHSSPPAILLAS